MPRSPFLPSLVLLYGLIASTAFAPPEPIDPFTQYYRPALEAAIREKVSNEEADSLVSFLGETDYASFADEIPSLARHAKNLPQDPREVEVLSRRYLNRIRSLFGELYAAKIARERLIREMPGSKLLTTVDYNRFNPEGTRPDGIMYRPLGDSIILEAVLESKMGPEKFNRIQARGYLEVWKSLGIGIAQREHFPSDKILIRHEGKLVPIRQLDLKALCENVETKTYLFGETPYKSDFAGTYIQLPLSTRQYSELAISFLSQLWKVPLNSTRVWPTRTTDRVSRTPIKPNIPVDDLMLYEWIISHGRFPKGGSSSPIEKSLAGYVTHIGGRVSVFANILGEDERRLLEKYDAGPATVPFQNWLLQSDGSDRTSVELLAYFLRLVGPQEGGAFVQKLKTLPSWQDTLRRFDYKELANGVAGAHFDRAITMIDLSDFCPWQFGAFRQE